MECLKENGQPNFFFQTAEINNDFYFVTKCAKGHITMTVLQEERFEILFDFACSAFLDGYYRDAVSNAAAAVERLHEFVVKVIVINSLINGDSDNASLIDSKIKQFEDKIWKKMKNQSERQLGAFYLAYFNTFNHEAPNFVEKNAELRNNTIHKGYIPSKEEAKLYLSGTFNYMLDVLAPLKIEFKESISILTKRNINNIISKNKNNKYPVSTLANTSVINLLSGEKNWEKRNFDAELNNFIDKNEHMKFLEKLSESSTLKKDIGER